MNFRIPLVDARAWDGEEDRPLNWDYTC